MINDLGEYLKNKVNLGISLPSIRYFDGNNMFSDIHGNYKGATLEESLREFFKELVEKNEK